MAYFAGKNDLKIGEKVFAPGDKLPTEEVKSWPNLRQLILTNYVTCDYRDGEPRPEAMNHVSRSSILTDDLIRSRLKTMGIEVPETAAQVIMWFVHNVCYEKHKLKESAAFFKLHPKLPEWVPENIRKPIHKEAAEEEDVEIPEPTINHHSDPKTKIEGKHILPEKMHPAAVQQQQSKNHGQIRK